MSITITAGGESVKLASTEARRAPTRGNTQHEKALDPLCEEEARQGSEASEQEALGELLQRLEPLVQGLAQADGYTYVFEKNEAGLFLAPAAHDLTSELIRKYNQRYPAKGKMRFRYAASCSRALAPSSYETLKPCVTKTTLFPASSDVTCPHGTTETEGGVVAPFPVRR